MWIGTEENGENAHLFLEFELIANQSSLANVITFCNFRSYLGKVT